MTYYFQPKEIHMRSVKWSINKKQLTKAYQITQHEIPNKNVDKLVEMVLLIFTSTIVFEKRYVWIASNLQLH